MKTSVKNLDVEEFYDMLGISPKVDDLKENTFFNVQENDEHLAWKSLKI